MRCPDSGRPRGRPWTHGGRGCSGGPGPKPLHRRIFYWFGASILVTVLMAGALAWVLARFKPTGVTDELARAEAHLSWHLKDRWHDPERRDALLSQIANDFRVRVILRDADGAEIAAFGPDCPRQSLFTARLRDEGAVFGRLTVCVPPRGRVEFLKLPLVLLLLAVALWAAAGVIARVIARPLRNVADVAAAIGRGDLNRRTKPVRHRTLEVQQLAESVDDMAARIQRQLADQRELLAAVSHELRTPLGHLRVLVELARGRKHDASKLETTLDGMESEVLEIDRLVGELLASSRLDFEIEHRNVVDAVELASHALERAQLPSSLLEGDSDVSFEGDATLIGRALANLLDNAERHAGGATRIAVVAADDRVRFEVEDRGPGVRPEDREKIFQPLRRGEERSASTLGLGLALVARIAEAHGGQAFVVDGEAGGARFVLDLPKRRS